jgi:hypothetical protein
MWPEWGEGTDTIIQTYYVPTLGYNGDTVHDTLGVI